uniref:Uncharacterized protein n=1 Tax=Amphimedon queenslandica TaxID=400682 RepID=A0A1X7TXE8_AMPQE
MTVIHHADLDGAPLLILANKQDREDALKLTEVESAFDTSVESIGNRDCRIQRVSALRGYVISRCGLHIDSAPLVKACLKGSNVLWLIMALVNPLIPLDQLCTVTSLAYPSIVLSMKTKNPEILELILELQLLNLLRTRTNTRIENIGYKLLQ